MSDVIVEKEGRVGIVTLNRPQAMNALNSALRKKLAGVMADLNADATISVVILTGAGDRAFCAGMDLKELGRNKDAIADANGATPEANPVLALGQCEKPIICAMNGVAAAGGFELVLACDVIIAAETARFADTHVRVGVLPGWGLSQKLPRLIGPYRAKELSLTGNFLDAQTACAWGLVNRVVAPQDLMKAARALAADMADVQLAKLIAVKTLIDDGYAVTLAEGLRLESETTTTLNGAMSAEEVERNRIAVLARGRAQ